MFVATQEAISQTAWNRRIESGRGLLSALCSVGATLKTISILNRFPICICKRFQVGA